MATNNSINTGKPIEVTNGGTGVATLTTAYAPVCAGTSATSALQVASTGLGTSGWVLTSTGASSLPTFQAVSGGITTINGNSGSATGSTVTLTGSTSGAVFTGSGSTITESFNYLSLPITSSTNGQILINAVPALQMYGTGSVFVGNAGNFTNSGSYNTGMGLDSLNAVTSGSQNSAYGVTSMLSMQSGSDNASVGYDSMRSNTSGSQNAVIGRGALKAAGSASANVAVGYRSLESLTGNSNVAIGNQAMDSLVSGTENIAIGEISASTYTGAESSNICINSVGVLSESNALHIGSGTGTGAKQLNSAFISGIQGIVVTGAAAIISSGDQLGVLASSKRFKENIIDMGDASSPIMQMRPVQFNYNFSDDKSVQMGLIAEEVEQLMPSLVTYDKDGQVFTVKYHDLHALMLNELQKAVKRIEVLEAKLSKI